LGDFFMNSSGYPGSLVPVATIFYLVHIRHSVILAKPKSKTGAYSSSLGRGWAKTMGERFTHFALPRWVFIRVVIYTVLLITWNYACKCD
jgi:hypothetical protein